MRESAIYWAGVIADGALVGIAAGLIALTLGVILNERQAAMKSFAGCVVVGLIGGLKLLGLLLVVVLWPVYEAYRSKKRRSAQQAIPADRPKTGSG
jgi:hypothetical protein